MTDVWLTPPYILKALGEFDLDPCSPLDRPWDTAKKHYTINDDGLLQVWNGRVWCNPPYSDVEPWAKKCADHQNAIMLVFSNTQTKWFLKHVWHRAESAFWIQQKIKFYNADGSPGAFTARSPSVLVSYGEHNAQALEESGLNGFHQPIKYTPMIIVGISPSWFSVVSMAVNRAGELDLKVVYDMVESIAPDKIALNQHWKAKVRQQIQRVRINKMQTETIEIN